jgi:hypothetical protein
MKTMFKCVVLAFAIVMINANVFAQEWTKAQKDVWQVVEDSWAKWKAGDMDGMMAAIHPRYQGWNDGLPLPITREMNVQWFNEMKDQMKVSNYEINPARIVVTDNAAVVDYFYSIRATYIKDDKKETKEGGGKNVEFYIKEGGKWMLLGDMTVQDKEEK